MERGFFFRKKMRGAPIVIEAPVGFLGDHFVSPSSGDLRIPFSFKGLQEFLYRTRKFKELPTFASFLPHDRDRNKPAPFQFLFKP